MLVKWKNKGVFIQEEEMAFQKKFFPQIKWWLIKSVILDLTHGPNRSLFHTSGICALPVQVRQLCVWLPKGL